MTPAATKPRPKASSVLADLERLERKWADATADESKVSKEYSAKLDRHRELHDKRRRLIYHEPGLVDGQGRPVDGEGEIAALDAQLAEIGNLSDAAAEVEHARRLSKREQQRVQSYQAENFDAIIEEIRPIGEARTEAVSETRAAYTDAVTEYLDFHRRVQGLVAAVRGDTREIPGLDAASELARSLGRAQDLPIPLPGDS